MNTLYSVVAQMLANSSGEDASRRQDTDQLAHDIVDAVVESIHENGFSVLDLAAAHDGPQQD